MVGCGREGEAGGRLTFFAIVALDARPVFLLCAVFTQVAFGITVAADLVKVIS